MSQPLVEIIQRKYVKGTHPAMRPRDASSIMLLDRRGRVPRVLMGRRNPAAKFMPGFFVLPGGRLDAGDGDVVHHGALQPEDLRRMEMYVQRPTPRRMKALALAAVRETFEETGLKLGVESEKARTAAAPKGWEDFLATGWIPTLDGVRFVARAITPPGRNRRFDTRFFLRDVTDFEVQETLRPTAESELVELAWVPLAEAHKLESAEITQIILGEIRQLVDAGLADSIARPMYRMRHRRFERVAL